MTRDTLQTAWPHPPWEPFLRRISARNARTLISKQAMKVNGLNNRVLEPAKSSRTTCIACEARGIQSIIAKGTLRFGYNVEEYDMNKYPRMAWYHATMDCIPRARTETILQRRSFIEREFPILEETIPSSVLGTALQGLQTHDNMALSTAECEVVKDILMRLAENTKLAEDEVMEAAEAFLGEKGATIDLSSSHIIVELMARDRKGSNPGATSQAADTDSPALSRKLRAVGTSTASAVPAIAQSVGSREDAAGRGDDSTRNTTEGPQIPRSTSTAPAVRVSPVDVRRGKSKGHKRAGANVQTRELYDYQPRVRAYLEAQYGKVSGRIYSDEKGVACELDMVVQIQVDNARQLKQGTELLVEIKVGTSRQSLKTARGELEWALAYARSSSSAAPVRGMLIVPAPLGEFELKTFVDAGIFLEIVPI